MKKRFLALLLSLCLTVGLLPTAAFAAEVCPSCGTTDGVHGDGCPYSDSELYCPEFGYLTYREDEDDYFHADDCSIDNQVQPVLRGTVAAPSGAGKTYTVDGVTYFGVNSDSFDKSSKQFCLDMLSAASDQLSGKSTAALWQYLAYCIQDDYGNGTDTGKFKRQFDDVIKNGLAYYTGGTGTYSSNLKSGDNNYNIRSSGLIYAGSVANAADAMENQVKNWYKEKGTRSKNIVASNSTLHNDTNSQDVFWMSTGAFKTSGTNKKGHYQALGVVFSDFSITVVVPKDDGTIYQTKVTELQPTSQVVASSVVNKTGAAVSAQQTVTETSSTTATSTISGSESFMLSSCTSLAYEAGIIGDKVTFSESITAASTIQEGWSTTKSETETDSQSHNVSVTLPAYTNVMVRQYESGESTTITYNCPVALNFKVTMVEYTLDPSHNNANPHTRTLGTFGSSGVSARQNLYKRGVVDAKFTDDENTIVWNNLYANHAGTSPTLQSMVANQMTVTAPMSLVGARFDIEDRAMTSEVTGLAPVCPLSVVRTTGGVTEYAMTSGEFRYVDNIGLEGLNSSNAAYYGFDPGKGHWILVDGSGTPLTNSPIATLETDPSTKYTKLIAGEQSGTVYLKYLIDEDCYSTASDPTTFRKNSDLSATAMIKVNVTAIPVESDIVVSGTLTGIVGDPAKPIEGADGLTVFVEDSSGKEVSCAVSWEAKELESRGIKVEDGRISFTQAGTFHVRAYTENKVYSDWYEVTALPARKLAVIQIPSTAAFDYRTGDTLDLNALTIYCQDQYGELWATPALTWSCGDAGTSVQNGVLMVPSAGVYTVTAKSGDVVSNVLTITVTDSTPRITSVTPAQTELTSSGGEVKLTIKGVNLPDGIVLTADGGVSAATTGTGDKQTATLTFPANTDTENNVEYTVRCDMDETAAATVTVAKKTTLLTAPTGAVVKTVTTTDAAGTTAKKVTVTDVTGETRTTVTAVVSAQAVTEAAATGTPVILPVEVTAAAGSEPAPEVILQLPASVSKESPVQVEIPVENMDYGVVAVLVNANGAEEVVKTSVMGEDGVILTLSGDATVKIVDNGKNFADVQPVKHWAEDAVDYVTARDLFQGTSAGAFSPNTRVTYGMVAAVLARYDGVDTSGGSAWYEKGMAWAVGNRVFNSSDPRANITREQLVTALWRYSGSPAAANSIYSYSDAEQVSGNATDAMSWAVSTGLINGVGNGRLDPQGTTTRAQLAAILTRYCQNASK